jgi:hypothetical protein
MVVQSDQQSAEKGGGGSKMYVIRPLAGYAKDQSDQRFDSHNAS